METNEAVPMVTNGYDGDKTADAVGESGDCANEEGSTRGDDEEAESEAVVTVDDHSLDHFLFVVVQVMSKMVATCSGVTRSLTHRPIINSILGEKHPTSSKTR